MRTHLKDSMVILLALGASTVSMAETHPAKTEETPKTLIRTNGVTPDSAVKALRANLTPGYQIPDAPRFLVVGQDKKFYLGIGGNIKATASYDWPNPIQNLNEFTTADIPMSTRKGNDGQFGISAQQSTLNLNMVALPGDKNAVGVYLSFNLLGNNYTPTLVQAYAKYRGFTVGYNYSLFSDMAAGVPTIDYEGPNSFTSIPNAVLDYTHQFNKNWSVGIGAELPQASYTNGRYTYRINQRIPDVPMYVQYNWAPNSWLRASGIIRNMYYRNNLRDANYDKIGWGVKLSGSTLIMPRLRAYYQGVYGRGISSYIQDLNGGGMDMVPDPKHNGELKAVEAWGAYGGLQYNFTKNVFASTTYSHVRTYAPKYSGGETSWGNQYRYAQYLVTNIFWQVNPMVQVGLEYLYGRKVDMSGVSRHDNRLQTAVTFSF